MLNIADIGKMKDYNDFKNWDPTKGDYINEEQKTLSRAEKARARRNKILFYVTAAVVVVAVIIYYINK